MQSILHLAILLVFTYSGGTRVAEKAPSPADFKWQPPSIQAPISLRQPSVLEEMVTSVRVAKLPVVLEETKLTNVQKRLGGSIGHRGDGSESLDWLCYYGADANGRWALWLESGEKGGGAIDGFMLQRLDRDARMDRRCGDLRTGEIELPMALKLGATEMQVRKILGKPTLKYRSTLVYGHEHAETLHNEPYTASNTVYVVLRKSVVWAIQVWKHTTS
jgi:hypothetical protein